MTKRRINFYSFTPLKWGFKRVMGLTQTKYEIDAYHIGPFHFTIFKERERLYDDER